MTFLYDDKEYEILITKKKNKHLYIRVDDNLNINITCPYLYTKCMVKEIIEKNQKDIVKMILSKKKILDKKEDEKYKLLGQNIDVRYEKVSKPIYNLNTLIVKDDNMLYKWYRAKAYEIFKIYLDEAYYAFEEKIPYPKLKIRNMKTRWGVCNRRDNSVTLNLELIKKDKMYLNYVIVHELSHFVHFDHSKAFWCTVEKYCPEYKKVRKSLRE